MRELSWRRWLAVSLLVAVGAALGVVYGLNRKPVYSSTATVSSARVNVLAEALPGYVSAATSLASTYARFASSGAVESAVASRLGLPLAAVRDRLAATPVPDDPIIMIVGTGRSALAARRLAATAAGALVAYVARDVVNPAAARATMAQYVSANAQLQRLSVRVERLRFNRSPGFTSPGLKAALSQQAEVQLRLRALASDYVNQSLAETSGASPQVLTAAGPVTSNRESRIEEYGAIGFVAGLLLGLLIERATSLPRRSRVRISRLERV